MLAWARGSLVPNRQWLLQNLPQSVVDVVDTLESVVESEVDWAKRRDPFTEWSPNCLRSGDNQRDLMRKSGVDVTSPEVIILKLDYSPTIVRLWSQTTKTLLTAIWHTLDNRREMVPVPVKRPPNCLLSDPCVLSQCSHWSQQVISLFPVSGTCVLVQWFHWS